MAFLMTHACWKSLSCYGDLCIMLRHAVHHAASCCIMLRCANICIQPPGIGLVNHPYWQPCSAVKIAVKGAVMHCSMNLVLLPANCQSNGNICKGQAAPARAKLQTIPQSLQQL